MHFNLCLVFFLTMIHSAPGEPTPKLKLIGTIGSHSYFYDYEEPRTWWAALEYCESLQMDLADLPTESHQQLIKNYASTDPVFAGELYWTSGRDSMRLMQFSWHNTKEPVAADLSFYGVNGPNTGLIVYTNGYLYGTPVNNRYGVLCQT